MSSSEFSPGVLVDFDGTIVDSLAPLQESFYRFLSLQGIEAPDIRFEDVMPLPIADLVRLLRDRYGWTSQSGCCYQFDTHARCGLLPARLPATGRPRLYRHFRRRVRGLALARTIRTF